MDTETSDLIQKTLFESIHCKENFWKNSRESFFSVAELLLKTLVDGKKILICGNGGSACDALHFAGELVNRFVRERRALPCIALNADTPLVTCIGNDYGFEYIFSRQVEALGQKDDVLIGISTSGNSRNVVLALEAAQKQGVHAIALLGGSGGKIFERSLFDHSLIASGSKNTARIQETHSWILHSLCEYIDLKLPS